MLTSKFNNNGKANNWSKIKSWVDVWREAKVLVTNSHLNNTHWKWGIEQVPVYFNNKQQKVIYYIDLDLHPN